MRLRRICSENEDFRKRVGELKGYLRARGYDMGMVENQIMEAMKIDRDESLREKVQSERDQRDVFVTTYHPTLSKNLHRIFRNNHSILTSREDHQTLFESVPMISYRRAKSLQDILVRAKLSPIEPEPNVCQGCNGRSDCEVCSILKKGSTFTNKDQSRTYDIRKGTLHCNTPLCVYLMSCNICSKQYVGKTKPKFRIRNNNYKTKFRKYFNAWKAGTLETDKPIEQAHLFQYFIEHIGDNFIDQNGKEDWSFWSFQIIDKSPNDAKLLERENFWIYKLKTKREDGGLNVQDVPVAGSGN